MKPIYPHNLSVINAMRGVLDLLNDSMLQVVDPSGVKNEVIVDLVDQCRSNLNKLTKVLATTVDEQLLGQGLELNDDLQTRHDAILPAKKFSYPTMNKRKEVIDIDTDDEDDCVLLDNVSSCATKDACLEAPMHQPVVRSQHFAKKNKRKSRKTYHAPQVVMPAQVVTPTPPRVDPKDVNGFLHRYNTFKKFDMVEDFSDHCYSDPVYLKPFLSKNLVKRMQEEWKILKESLPDRIFVRVSESRMDLMRAVIVGVEGTPFHDGLFFFDFYFPNSYPNCPPLVHYYSGGIQITSNLFSSGNTCISLLNTWHGERCEKWIRGTSTILQVLVSLQSLVLSAKPFFNDSHGVDDGDWSEKDVLGCNEATYLDTLRTMLYNIHRVPLKHFEDFVVGHFLKHGRDILACCKAYMNGAQVGCVTKGLTVQEGDKSRCHDEFMKRLSGRFDLMVSAFLHIGAKDCEEFLPPGVPPIPFYRSPNHPSV